MPLYEYTLLHNLLNVLVQIANKMGLQKMLLDINIHGIHRSYGLPSQNSYRFVKVKKFVPPLYFLGLNEHTS
jgi:hypothetical protein